MTPAQYSLGPINMTYYFHLPDETHMFLQVQNGLGQYEQGQYN